MRRSHRFTAPERALSRSELIEIYKANPNQFEALNRLATQICGTPVSLVNMLDDNFQYSVSRSGDWKGVMTLRKNTACQFTVDEEDDLLVINDTKEDERTGDITELIEDDNIRFYAGAPIKDPGGARIGAFCVIDYEPRNLNEAQKTALRDLADEVEVRIRLLLQKRKLEIKNRKLDEAAAFLNNSADLFLKVNPGNFEILESDGAMEIFGIPDDDIVGNYPFSLVELVDMRRHLKLWLSNPSKDKITVPAKFKFEGEGEVWVDLTFSRYRELLLVTGRDVTKEFNAKSELKESLREKDVLLAEIHHRVKNNLAVIVSLLELEQQNTDLGELAEILNDCINRILSIAKIHEHLYQLKSFSKIEMDRYLEELVEQLEHSFSRDDKQIRFEVKAGDIEMNANQALPLGLVVSELVSNAYKHAFEKGEQGDINVSLTQKRAGQLELVVHDNGKGIRLTEDSSIVNSSLGYTLIKTLTKQLNADLSITNKEGTRAGLLFPNKVKSKGAVSTLH